MGKKHQNVTQSDLLGFGGKSPAAPRTTPVTMKVTLTSTMPADAAVEKKSKKIPITPAVMTEKKKPAAAPSVADNSTIKNKKNAKRYMSPTDIAFGGTSFPVNDPVFKSLRKLVVDNTTADEMDSNNRGSGGGGGLSSPRGKLVNAERTARLRRDVSLGKRRVGEKDEGSSSWNMSQDDSSLGSSGGEGSFSDAIDLDDELCAEDGSDDDSDSDRYGAMHQGGDGNDYDLPDQSSGLEDEDGDSDEDGSITSSILAQLEAEGVLDEDEEDGGDFSSADDGDEDAEYADAQETLKHAPAVAAANKKNGNKGGSSTAVIPHKKRQRGDDEDFIIKGADGERSQMVHFDGYPYALSDLENSLHLLDSFIPDHMLEVDRDAFAALLRGRDSTIIIKQGDDEDDDEEEESVEEDSSDSDEGAGEGPLSSKARRLEEDPNVDLSTADDIFGIYGLVDICPASNANKKDFASMSVAFKQLMDAPWLVLESGVRSVGDLLGAAIPNSRLLVMDCLKTIPPDVSAGALQAIVDAHGPNAGFQVIVLGKAQKSAEALDADHAKKKKNKKARVEGGGGAAAPSDVTTAATLNLKEEYVFWRMCDEVLYEHRDPKTSVTLYKNRSQYDEQPDLERPLSIGFSLTWDAFQKAVKACAKKASETTGFGAM